MSPDDVMAREAEIFIILFLSLLLLISICYQSIFLIVPAK